MEKLKLKRKELNITSSFSNEVRYLKNIEKSIESLKKASIKKQNKINYKFIKKEYKTAIGAKFIASESFLSEALSCFEREYIKEKNKKQKLEDKEFRIEKLKELKSKGFNSQKLSILIECVSEKLGWILLAEFISHVFKETLDTLKKYFYSIQRSTKLLLGSVALEKNRVLLN
ncbi:MULTISPECIES: hypothetical protein [Psychrilyobacter]|nr:MULTISPECIES: hypothetical protein [Psychrilyobacter]NDI77733.1 hypothetical protein [Psychrilyobacter piezotolerans]